MEELTSTGNNKRLQTDDYVLSVMIYNTIFVFLILQGIMNFHIILIHLDIYVKVSGITEDGKLLGQEGMEKEISCHAIGKSCRNVLTHYLAFIIALLEIKHSA